MSSLLVAIALSVGSTLAAAPAPSSDAPSPDQQVERTPEATPLSIEAPVKAVTMYRGRAAVTRRGAVRFDQGIYELRFANLPESVDAASLQARATGAGRILAVDFVQRAVAEAEDPVVIALDRKIEDVKRRLAQLADEQAVLLQQSKLVDGVAVRVANDASDAAGTAKLDLEALRRQMTFVGEQRTALSERVRSNGDARQAAERQLAVLEADRRARATGATVVREAVVTLAAAERGEAGVELTYLVANAGWEPTYSVRAAPPASTVTIEYDALLQQRSGEDWTDVEMVLSTAEPMRAANPPSVSPWFVEVRKPLPPPPPASAPAPMMDARAKSIDDSPAYGSAESDGDSLRADALRKQLEGLSSDASVAGSGPAVSYRLPRTVTVLTNADREQRTRIANLDVDASFVRIAAPSLTEDVYLKAALLNTSDYQLLPGRAAIFLDGDFIGPTAIPSTAPGAEVDLHFGVDRSLRARRQLLRKEEGSAGFFGGSARVAYDYRIELDNPGNAAVAVELWDRIPVSRDERIKIVLDGPSAPLATDAEYVNEQRTQGLLKWIVQVPAGATGKSAYAITYGVRVEHPKDLDITALPE